jgi:hypothetical protein
VNAKDVNCAPWSEWVRLPWTGLRDEIAMPSAFVTSAAVGDESIDHPMTRRENASSTTQQ